MVLHLRELLERLRAVMVRLDCGHPTSLSKWSWSRISCFESWPSPSLVFLLLENVEGLLEGTARFFLVVGKE